MNIFEKHLDLVQRAVYHGLHSLTFEERAVIGCPIMAKYPLDRYLDDIMRQEELKIWMTILT